MEIPHNKASFKQDIYYVPIRVILPLFRVLKKNTGHLGVDV